jgi:hypothetical protein
MRDDRELMKLEGAEAISQLQDLADLVKYQIKLSQITSGDCDNNSTTLQYI